MINGRPGLICKEPAKDEMTLEPLPFLPIIRDLVVDREPLLQKIYSIPGLTRSSPAKEHPEPIEPEKVEEMGILRQCAQCLACVAVCPCAEELTAYIFPGPTELMRISRFAFDVRDGLERAKESDGARVFDCVYCHACEEVCPHDIDITDKVITTLRSKCLQEGIGVGTRYVKAFTESVQKKGKISAAVLFIKTQGYSRAVLKMPKGLRLACKGKLVSPFQKPVPKAEEIRKLFRLEREKK